ncbi:hypothetical protein JAAARDRAFT_199417 [Jaapia argillacea MUCL 33604]|uniref:HIT-type domain-containing protein n=1 Tax=Jaapia argillacea MUCL 33604 TaxID=933084 RepID=A0A067PKQ1_9AGAM|nr:hypothetical protein JAAARDRAFT_199417 [Jaapia argillacea MUCL 33604]
MASSSVSLSSPPLVEPLHQLPCGICRRQFAKYNCPTCNLPYCSLTCFRSESHNQCSESFYRKELETDIQSSPSKTAEERLKMMEVLRRFEQDQLEGEHDLEDEEDEHEEADGDEENDLAKRMRNIDLDSASPENLWSFLTPSQRTKFLSALTNPSSELTQQLLSSSALERELVEPWWEAPEIEEEPDLDEIGANHREPQMCITIPTNLIKPLPLGSPLLYNACAITIAYAYTSRHLSLSPLSSPSEENEEPTKLLSTLIPFLFDKKSTIRFGTLESAIADLWARFNQGTISPSSFSTLLKDTANLIRPSRITKITSPPSTQNPKTPEDTTTSNQDFTSHPSRKILLVLSDLYSLFSPSLPSDPPIPKSPQISRTHTPKTHIAHKLTFYASQILSTPPFILDALANECEVRAERMVLEELEVGGEVKRVRGGEEVKIVELS